MGFGLGIINAYRLARLNSQWRKYYPETLTAPGNWFPHEILEVGRGTYGIINVVCNGMDSMIRIGNWCSISPGVSFVISSEHNVNTATTYPFKVKLLRTSQPEAMSKGDITVGDDVWIGHRATILDGVTIGQGSIVGAGALVTQDIPPYAIVGGVPAKVIRFRHQQEVIDELMKFNWQLVDETFVKQHIDELYKANPTVEDINKLVRDLESSVSGDSF